MLVERATVEDPGLGLVAATIEVLWPDGGCTVSSSMNSTHSMSRTVSTHGMSSSSHSLPRSRLSHKNCASSSFACRCSCRPLILSTALYRLSSLRCSAFLRPFSISSSITPTLCLRSQLPLSVNTRLGNSTINSRGSTFDCTKCVNACTSCKSFSMTKPASTWNSNTRTVSGTVRCSSANASSVRLSSMY